MGNAFSTFKVIYMIDKKRTSVSNGLLVESWPMGCL